MDDVQFLTVWGAYGGGDDRRAPDELLGWFSSRSSAELAADKQGWYGGPGRVQEHKAVRIDGKVYPLAGAGFFIDLDGEAAKAKQRVRDQALAKLTPVEIAALGLTPAGGEGAGGGKQ